MTKRITIRLTANLLNRAKRRLRLMAAESGRVIKRKHALPPVSGATGGPMPGNDLTDLSALVEMEDLDAVQRMLRFK